MTLKSDRQIIVYGASKQGKTALVSKFLFYDDNIVISCNPKSQVSDIYKSILRKLDIEILTEHHKSKSADLEVGAIAKFIAKIPFIGSGEAEVSQKWGNYNFEAFVSLFDNDKDKILVIDSAEKILFSNNRETLKSALNIVIENNWKVIFTIRHDYYNDFLTVMEFQDEQILNIVNIESIKNMGDYIKNLTLPSNKKLLSFISTPFFLKEYLAVAHINDKVAKTVDEFYESIFDLRIWNKLSRFNNLHTKRYETAMKIAKNSFGDQYNPYNSMDVAESEALYKLGLWYNSI